MMASMARNAPEPMDDDFLQHVSIFARLPDDVRRRVAASMERVSLRAGAWLFRQGDPGDALYVVRSGRLQVIVAQGSATRVVTTLGPGDVIGEMSLLSGGRRSASARAIRTVELARLDHHRFIELLHADVAFAVELTRLLGQRLQSGISPPPRRPTWRVAGLSPLQRKLPVLRIAEALAAAFGDRVGLIHRGMFHRGVAPSTERPAQWSRRLDAAERDCDRVLLCAEEPIASAGFGEFCVEQADRVIAIVDPNATPPPPALPSERLRGAELFLLGREAPAGAVAPWLDLLAPRAVHWIDPGDDFSTDVARAARRLSGRSLGVVLAGGGARGLAHIGALEVLVEAGLTIDQIGGASMGAFIAGLFARGLSGADMRELCRREFVKRNPFNDYALSLRGIIRGNKARDTLQRIFGDARIEGLRPSYFCISADLISAQEVVHRRGPMAEAIGWSMSLPGMVPPHPTERGLLVDGGVLNNLPVDVMEEAGEGPVLAVDLVAPPPAHPATDPTAKPLDILSTLGRCVALASARKSEINRARADVAILPDVGAIGLFDFKRLDELVDAGRRAAEALLEQCRAVV
jgi:predicted acylesterase/phospholipase RssA